MEKSSDAFRTISEVADDLDLPQHVLRFWETRFPHIRPLKRAGGRRYYRPADISLLRTIRQLLYDEGYTIKGVQRLLKEQGPRSLRTGQASAASDVEDLVLPEVQDGFEGLPHQPEPALSIPESPTESLSSALAPPPGLRAGLLDLLGTVEECARILHDLRRPT